LCLEFRSLTSNLKSNFEIKILLVKADIKNKNKKKTVYSYSLYSGKYIHYTTFRVLSFYICKNLSIRRSLIYQPYK
jgi:hypothetical protein